MELNHDDVVTVSKWKSPLKAETFRVSEIARDLANRLVPELHKDIVREWASNGVMCQVLKTNGRWQNGRVRFSLEFIPDEEEPDEQEATVIEEAETSPVNLLPSPLDDLRSDLNI